MQIKKEDLKQSIYNAACDEFMRKGYEAASMRRIALKANTSIGNIYHYYSSKEALLDEMMQQIQGDLFQIVKEHFQNNRKVSSLQELDEELVQLEKHKHVFTAFLRPEIVVFLELKIPKYQEERKWFLDAFHQHMAWHMNASSDDYFIKLIVHMFMESVIFIIKSNQSKEKALQDFIGLFRMLCSGIISK